MVSSEPPPMLIRRLSTKARPAGLYFM